MDILERKVRVVFEHHIKGLEILGSVFSGEKCKILGKIWGSNNANTRKEVMGRMQKGIRKEVVLKPKRSPWDTGA